MKIKPTGYEHLSKADWKNLTTLSLGNYRLSQLAMILTKMGVRA
jgi:hypothetical protein